MFKLLTARLNSTLNCSNGDPSVPSLCPEVESVFTILQSELGRSLLEAEKAQTSLSSGQSTVTKGLELLKLAGDFVSYQSVPMYSNHLGLCFDLQTARQDFDYQTYLANRGSPSVTANETGN